MEESKGIAVVGATGLDVSDRYSHYCVVGEDGAVREEGRIRTTPKALEEHFAPLAPSRVALEVGRHSPWISRLLGAGTRAPVPVARWSPRVARPTLPRF